MLDIRAAQELIMKNKRDKGFNVSDVPYQVCLLQGEIAEFFDAWRHQRDNAGEELADVAIYVLSLAAMTDIDLAAEIESKIEKNARRVYARNDHGALVKAANNGAPKPV